MSLNRSFIFCLLSGLVFASFPLEIKAQFRPDSAGSVFLLVPQFKVQLPAGDLAKRFGTNAAVGVMGFQKNKKGFTFGFDWNYMFGRDVRQPEMFNEIGTVPNDDGKPLLIDKNGQIATIRTWERGFQSHLHFGGVFYKIGPNPNCGFMATGGVGILYHRIRIEDIGNKAPQIAKEYRKGYDRLSYGISTSQFIGYLYLSNNRYFNLYGGVETIQGFTKNRRGYNFDEQAYDNASRLDLLYGFKIGLVVPIYRRSNTEYYVY